MIKIPEVVSAVNFAEADILTTLSTSTQIVIQAQTENGNVPVGAVKSFEVVQNRSFEQLEVVLPDGSTGYELVPGPTDIKIYLQRTVFDGLALPEALGCSFRSIAAQSRPFDVQVFTIDDESAKTTTTTYHNCWFSRMATPVKADDYVIIEEATVLCERISFQGI